MNSQPMNHFMPKDESSGGHQNPGPSAVPVWSAATGSYKRRSLKLSGTRISARSLGLLICLTCPINLEADEVVGFLEPSESIEVAASESGTIAELSVKVGDSVKAGTPFGFLDREVLKARRDVAASRAQQKARSEAARLELENLQKRYDSLLKLRQGGFGNSEEVERAATDRNVAQTTLDAVNEEIEISRLQMKQIEAELRRRELRSPINGVVLKLHRKKGEFVTANEPDVATVADLDALRVKFYVPAAAAFGMVKGQHRDVEIPLLERRVIGKIDFVAPVINAESGTVQVEVVFDNRSRQIKSGLRCTMQIDVPQTPAMTSSPRKRF